MGPETPISLTVVPASRKELEAQGLPSTSSLQAPKGSSQLRRLWVRFLVLKFE